MPDREERSSCHSGNSRRAIARTEAAPRPASINDNIRQAQPCEPAVIRARSLLHGSNVGAARREQRPQFRRRESFDFANGSILLYLPKGSGMRRINTAVATAAGNSFTAMAEYHPKSWIKFIILEGHVSISLKHHPGETQITPRRANDSRCAPARRSCESRRISIFPS